MARAARPVVVPFPRRRPAPARMLCPVFLISLCLRHHSCHFPKSASAIGIEMSRDVLPHSTAIWFEVMCGGRSFAKGDCNLVQAEASRVDISYVFRSGLVRGTTPGRGDPPAGEARSLETDRIAADDFGIPLKPTLRNDTGTIFPVNPAYPSVLNHACYPSIADLPETPEVAAFCLSHARIRYAFVAAAERGIKGAVIYDGGFAE